MLFRAAHHSDVLEVELLRRNIPFVKYGGLKFLEAAHVKDALAMLRLLENPRDEVAWFRVLQLLEGHGPGQRAAPDGRDSACAEERRRRPLVNATRPSDRGAEGQRRRRPAPSASALAGCLDERGRLARRAARTRSAPSSSR